MRRTKTVGIILILMLAVLSQPAPANEKASAASERAAASAARLAAFVSTPDRPYLAERNPRYIVQKGDVLEITFTFTPEYNRTVTIQPNGFVNLRSISDLRLEGKTTPEVVELLKTAYSKILHDPVITVELKEFEKPYFIATGEVNKPSKYDLRGDTTIAQAVAIAGGFTEKSKHSQVLLFHRVSNAWAEAKQFDLKQMLSSGNLTEDPLLRPGDMVFVPKNTLSKIKPFIPIPTLPIYLNN